MTNKDLNKATIQDNLPANHVILLADGQNNSPVTQLGDYQLAVVRHPLGYEMHHAFKACVTVPAVTTDADAQVLYPDLSLVSVWRGPEEAIVYAGPHAGYARKQISICP